MTLFLLSEGLGTAREQYTYGSDKSVVIDILV